MYFCPGSTTKTADSSGAPMNIEGMVLMLAHATSIAIKNAGSASSGIRNGHFIQMRSAIPLTLKMCSEGSIERTPPMTVPRTV